jgi:UDP-N-acetylmuramate--alanine ligase
LVKLIHQGSIGNATVGNGDWLIIEADESDGSIVNYHAELGLLLNIEKDHKEINELMAIFSAFRDNSRQFIVNQSHPLAAQLSVQVGDDFSTDSLQQAGYMATDFAQQGLSIQFKINDYPFTMQAIGRHNMENVVAAVAVASNIGVLLAVAAEAVANYEGIYRRHQIIGQKDGVILIDDYAHHPAELAALISGVRSLYSKQKLTLVFQPHLFSRTQDLCNGFAESLSAADEVILLPIYPARELPIPGVTSEIIAHKMTHKNVVLLEKEAVSDWIKKQQPKLLVMAGAGDIDVLIRNIKNDL